MRHLLKGRHVVGGFSSNLVPTCVAVNGLGLDDRASGLRCTAGIRDENTLEAITGTVDLISP